MPTSIIAEWTELLDRATGRKQLAGGVVEYSKTWRLRLTDPFINSYTI
jgi:hypothetical protein